MPVVGSSSSSSAGSDSSAIANRSRCCSPPEHLPTLRSAMPADAGASRAPRRPAAVSANRLAVYGDGLADGEVLEQPAGLHHRGRPARGRSPGAAGGRGPRPSRWSAATGRGPCRWWWSCRRRWGRGRRRSRPARCSRSMPRTAWTGPKSLVTSSRRIAGTVAPPDRAASRGSVRDRGVHAVTMTQAAPSYPAAPSRPGGDKCQDAGPRGAAAPVISWPWSPATTGPRGQARPWTGRGRVPAPVSRGRCWSAG